MREFIYIIAKFSNRVKTAFNYMDAVFGNKSSGGGDLPMKTHIPLIPDLIDHYCHT